MRFQSVLSACVALLLIVPSAVSVCFPDSERRVLRTDLEPIRLGQGDWNGARVNNLVAKILLEEKLGIPASIIDIGSDDTVVFEMMDRGDLDAYMELWAMEDVLAHYVARGSVQYVGPLGVIGRYGWYIPDYVAELSRSMTQYDAYYFAETVAIFQLPVINSSTTSVSDSTSPLTVAESVEDLLASDTCNPANSSATLQACYDALAILVDQVRELSRLQENNTNLITFWTAPPSWSPIDATIVRNLELPMNVTEIPMLPEDNGDVEAAMVRNMAVAYAARKPFMMQFYVPHPVFSPLSGIGLKRVQLPDYSEDCNALGDGYNCDYESDILKKLAWTGLKRKNSVAHAFISQFSYTALDQQNIVAALVYHNATLEDAACDWLKDNRALWERGLPDPNTLVTPSTAASGARVALFVLAGFVVMLCVVMAVMVWGFRRVRIIQSASPVYLELILLGAVMSMLWIFLDYSDDPSSSQCTARVWMRHLGFGVMFAALFLKTYRIARVFQQVTVSRSTPLSDRRLFYRFLEMNAFVVSILIVWTVVNPSHPDTMVSGNQSYQVCGITWWDNAMYIIELVALCVLAVVCFNVRKAPSAFNESKFIALSVYNWIVVASILQIILRATTGNATFFFIIEALEVLLTVPIIVGLLFVPKLYLTLKGKGGEVSTSSYRGASTPRPNNNNTLSGGDRSSAKEKQDIEMSSKGGSESETQQAPKQSSANASAAGPSGAPARTSGKSDHKELRALRNENARLLKETEALRSHLLRLNNPHV